MTFEMRPKRSKGVSCGEIGSENRSGGDQVFQAPTQPMWLVEGVRWSVADTGVERQLGVVAVTSGF